MLNTSALMIEALVSFNDWSDRALTFRAEFKRIRMRTSRSSMATT